MIAARLIFLGFMTWLLVVFLPAHTRGAMTMGPREAATADGTTHVEAADDCCAPATRDGAPTPRDRANCAVCHWAAGLLTTPAFALDLSHAERALERAHAFDAQVRRVARHLTRFGRDPPRGR